MCSLKWPRWVERKVDITGIGTILLALATFAAVWVASKALGDATNQIALSRAQLEVAERQAGESHRPVVIGVGENGPLVNRRAGNSRGEVPGRPYVLPYNGPALQELRRGPTPTTVLIVPVENIGSGPALDVSASVTAWVARHNIYTNVRASEQTPGVTAGLGAGSTVQLEIHIQVPKTSDIFADGAPGFVLRMTYRDVSEKNWITATTWAPLGDRYAGSAVGAG